MPTRHKRKNAEEYQTYIFQIDEVRPTYALGTNEDRPREPPYGEYLHVEFLASCVSPEKFAGRKTRLLFIGSRSLVSEVADPRSTSTPMGVGTLTMRGDRSEYLGSLPYDAAIAVPQFALAGGIRIIYLHGLSMRHGRMRAPS